MQIWPAIDIRDGKCVRLKQGDYQQETVYGDSPVEMAKQWVDQGAQYLHLVDLDAARDGSSANFDSIAEVAKQLRGRTEYSELPIIFITARGQQKQVEEGLASGGNRYVTKPFTQGELKINLERLWAKFH